MVARLLATLALLFFACTSAQMVEKRGKSHYAPVNERSGGVVRYALGGADFVLRERREDAYKQMFEECRGRYSITREWDEDGERVTSQVANAFANANASGTSTTYDNPYGSNGTWNATGSGSVTSSSVAVTAVQRYRNIEFACESAPSAR